MSRSRAGESVTAVMGNDGRVYFEYQPVQKPSRAPLPDWLWVMLSLLVVAAVVAAAFAI